MNEDRRRLLEHQERMLRKPANAMAARLRAEIVEELKPVISAGHRSAATEERVRVLLNDPETPWGY